MNREEQIDYLIRELKKEGSGYEALQDPVNLTGKRRLLRSLMNVRFPNEVSESFLKVQNALLQAELSEKNVVDAESLPAVGAKYPCTSVKNVDRIVLWKGDMTCLKIDAIVNAANRQMLGCFVPCHGCIDNVIHSAAGVELRNECATLMMRQGHEEPAGKAKITKAYNLPSKYVLHTVGPIIGGEVTKEQISQLQSCYLNCMKLAEQRGIHSVAFCCIATGEFHFPNKLAAQIALSAIDQYLSGSELERVVINVFKEEDANIYKKLLS